MSVISVTSEEEVVDAVRQAREWRAPFEIVGAGTKRDLGRAVTLGSTLDVSGLNGIVAYEHDELILTARAGTPVVEIEATLAEKNQRLGFAPADWGPLLGQPPHRGTIGGAISADANGSARVRYGAARDHLLGIRAVNGFGEAFKAGGKVVKNVTGFDVPKLVCGAMGTLSVLTEVTLRVFPKARLATTLAVRGLPPDDGLALLRRIWSSPLEATGLAFSRGAAFIRLEGEKEPLAEKLAMVRALIGSHDVEEIAEGDLVFDTVANGGAFDDMPYDVWRAYVPPAQAAAVAAAIDAPLWLADWAGGLLWLGTVPGTDNVRVAAQVASGHAILLRAAEEIREKIPPFEPEDAARASLTRAVKAAFDPLGLFNPGRMWDGI